MQDLAFSPLDLRYKKDIPETLSEKAFLKAQVTVEKEYLLGLMSEGLCPSLSEKSLDKILDGVSSDEIDQIEKRTQHATRALVEVIAKRLKKAGHGDIAHWVHVGITSFDTVDTAYRLRLKNYFALQGFGVIEKLKESFLSLAKKYQEIPQVGRTHGQWAVPSRFGLMFAEAYTRIAELEMQLFNAVKNLRGQISGAVGGYQATGLLVENPLEFESKILKRLDLKPHLGSTQIIPPEDLVALAQNVFLMASVVTKVANDLRHLARSEIGEIAEGLSPGQVGSSTMPQKRNPWNLEHVCSLFKVLSSRLHLLEIDMVTEHQRDLTNSASGRFYVEFFCVAHLMWVRLEKVLSRLECFPEAMTAHLEKAGTSIYAEALYVLLTAEGVEGAHDFVRECSREAEKKNLSLFEVVKSKNKLPKKISSIKNLENIVLHGPQMKLSKIVKMAKNPTRSSKGQA
jgi:adenylosuccinate lyase